MERVNSTNLQLTSLNESLIKGETENKDMTSTEPNSPCHEVKIELVPDGGWGWAVCAAAFFVQFIVLGVHNCFGILYTKLLEEFKKSKSETAWVGSVSVGVMYLFGPITSGLCQRVGSRAVGCVGGVLCVLGMLLTSFVNDLPRLYVTYGFLWGLGSSFCYFPSLIVPGEYFCQRLSLVNGIITAGSGLGTLALGPALQYMLESLGLVITLRILSGVSSILLLAALAYKPFRSPIEEIFEIKRDAHQFIDFQLWKNQAFVVYTGAVALFMLGYFIPYVHLVSHVEGLGVNPSNAALLIGYMSIASTIGRLIFGKFSDHPMVNRLYLTQFAVLGFGVTTTLIPIATSYQSLAAMVVMLGLFDGLYVVLIAVVNTDIVGAHKLSHALGNLYGAISVTITVGPPLAGLMYDAFGSYHTAFFISGGTSTAASCLMFLVPWLMPEDTTGGISMRDSHERRISNLLSSGNTPRMSPSPSFQSTVSTELDLLELCLSGRASANSSINLRLSRRSSITKVHLVQQSGSKTGCPSEHGSGIGSSVPADAKLSVCKLRERLYTIQSCGSIENEEQQEECVTCM